MKYRFASASPSETIVFGAQRPGYSQETVAQNEVAEWIAFMRGNGVRRVCCLLPLEQLAYYVNDLLSSYRESFGEENVCHVSVEDFHLIDRTDLEQKVLPFLRHADKKGTPVVVHCSGGSGRTGHVLAAWLVRERGVPIEKALALVSSERNPREAVSAGNATDEELVALLSGGN